MHVEMKFACEVTEVSTFMVITHGFKKLHKTNLYASLANVSTFMLRQLVWPLYNPVSCGFF